MLTKEDKIFLIKHAKNGTTPFVNTGMDTWDEDGIKMGKYYSDLKYCRTLYRGTYQDCIKWELEADAYYTDAWKRFRAKEEEEYRALGIEL